MRLRRLWLISILALMIMALCEVAPAEDLRLGASLGYGSAGAQNNGTTRVEAPVGFDAFLDYSLDSRLTIGVEHERSFQSGSTAIGVTDLSSKWYFWTPQPQIIIPSNQIEKTTLIDKNIVPYLGAAVGLAQASFPKRKDSESDVLVVDPYVSLRGGFEYPITGRWGSRAEFNFGMSVGGQGEVQLVHIFLGIYYFL